MARKKGSGGKAIDERRKTMLEEIKHRRKKTPIEFLLRVMWNRRRPLELRIEAAKAAAPYIHKKMPMELQHTGEVEIIPPFVPSREQIAENMANQEDDE